ncbi:MAG: potassium channel family protein [Nannocystaceae bacterium]|nr:potassium channel family protein [Nannocystaceae bacterium]
MSIRRRIWDALQPTTSRDRVGRAVDVGIATTIVVAIVALVLESMPSLAGYSKIFGAIEVVTLSVFVPEYALRLWACKEDPRYSGALGRLRWAVSASAIIDFLAIAPAVASAGTVDLRVLRGLRLLRLFRLGRYSKSLHTFGRVLGESRQQLIIALSLVLIVLLISSSLLYLVEREQQPEAFGSIPAAMWWGVATLTTVGYGDVRPITDLGRVVASVIAVLGIGTFAMPAGIIAGAFDRVVRGEEAARKCPHCARTIDELQPGMPRSEAAPEQPPGS